jgi:hypothetical protein
MAFRRDGARSYAWQQWLAKHQDELVAIGLPDWIYTDQQCWTWFLQECGLDWESGWGVEMLSPQQAKRFREFIVLEYGSEEHKCCLRELQKRVTVSEDRVS